MGSSRRRIVSLDPQALIGCHVKIGGIVDKPEMNLNTDATQLQRDSSCPDPMILSLKLDSKHALNHYT
jgi:hypothetical protein